MNLLIRSTDPKSSIWASKSAAFSIQTVVRRVSALSRDESARPAVGNKLTSARFSSTSLLMGSAMAGES